MWVLDLPKNGRLGLSPGPWAISFPGESPSSGPILPVDFLSKNHSCCVSQDLADNCTSTAYPCLEGSAYNRGQQFLSTQQAPAIEQNAYFYLQQDLTGNPPGNPQVKNITILLLMRNSEVQRS